MDLDPKVLERMVAAALAEDIGPGDVTTETVIPPDAVATGEIVSKGEGILCGIPVAREVFRQLDPEAEFEADLRDGDPVAPGRRLIRVRGKARALLSGERTALNFLQRLSGVATLTRACVDAVARTGVKIYDTRKTTPLWRFLEKHAVRCGGGENHRMGLHDQALLKENHLAFVEGTGDAWRHAIARAHRRAKVVIVEARDHEEALRAARAGADGVMLDNFPVEGMRETIPALRALPGGGPFIEVSGGLTMGNLREVASLGPDRVSIGAITHSAPSIDLSMAVLPDLPLTSSRS